MNRSGSWKLFRTAGLRQRGALRPPAQRELTNTSLRMSLDSRTGRRRTAARIPPLLLAPERCRAVSHAPSAAAISGQTPSLWSSRIELESCRCCVSSTADGVRRFRALPAAVLQAVLCSLVGSSSSSQSLPVMRF